MNEKRQNEAADLSPEEATESVGVPMPAFSAAVEGTEAPKEIPGSPDAAETGEKADELRAELGRARERVTQLERERILLGQGVPEDDLDYYVFKIGKLVSAEKDFRTAAKEFLKEHGAHPRFPAQRSTGASLTGRTTRTQSTSDTMNRLLRGQ